MTQIYRILVLPGDHVGPEVMAEALKVLKVVEECCPHVKFELSFDLAGGCSIDAHGTPITAAVLAKASVSDAVLFGSVGGPEWAHRSPTAETGLLRLRQHLDAFANIRPCEVIAESLCEISPIKQIEVIGTRFIVVRENCGGAYFGNKIEQEDRACDRWEYSAPEVERMARVSAAVAQQFGSELGYAAPTRVWSADKANVLASSRLWRRVTQDVFDREFPGIELRHQLADSMAMLMVKKPPYFNGVIHTDNTFGDILSDISGGLTGSLGLLPSASLCDIPGKGRCKGIYEPVHGSAPDISGKGRANPVAQIRSAAMMLRYSFLLHAEARAVETAVARVLEYKHCGGLDIRTADIGGCASTTEVGDAVCVVLRSLLGGSVTSQDTAGGGSLDQVTG